MATRILFDPRQDLPDGTTSPTAVTVEATPTAIRTDGAVVIFPTTQRFTVSTAADPIVLATPGAGQAWRLVVRRGSSHLEQRTVTWTAADEVEWGDLTDLDPATLIPTPDVTAAWAAALAGVTARVDAVLNGAPGNLDTFFEVATQMGLDEATVTTLQALVAGKADTTSVAATYLTGQQQFGPIVSWDAAPCGVTVTNDVSGSQVPNVRSTAPGFLATYAPNDLSRFTYLGSEPTIDTGLAFPDNQSASFDYVTGVHSIAEFTAESQHSGRYVEYFLKQYDGAQYWIWVDGKPLTPVPHLISGTAGSTGSILLDFGPTGGYRRVQLRATGIRFYGANVDISSRLLATTRYGARIVVTGDSYAGGAGPVTSLSTFVRYLAAQLQITDVWNLAVGGTGYLNPGTTSKAIDRIGQITRLNPDAVIVALGHNDENAALYPRAALTAATSAYLTALRTALPATQIILTGPFSAGISTTAYADVQAAIFAGDTGIANARIDTITHNPFTGTGNIGAKTGDGNSDLFIQADATHPTQDGAASLGWWMTLKLRPLLLISRFGEVAPPAPTTGIPFTDAFTRADTASTLGTYWSALTGTWGISSNTAYCPTGGGQNFAVHDAETPDVTVQATVAGSSAGNQGIGLRCQDGANGYIIAFADSGAVKLYKQVSGAFTQLGSAAATVVTGDVMKVTAAGSTITVYQNGTQLSQVTDSTFLNASLHGLWGFGAADAATRAWDGFTLAAA